MTPAIYLTPLLRVAIGLPPMHVRYVLGCRQRVDC
jgi:hypothetical protein